jgi:hypothetical protein
MRGDDKKAKGKSSAGAQAGRTPALLCQLPQRESEDGHNEQQTARHEFSGLGETDGEDDDQKRQDNIYQSDGDASGEDIRGAKNQQGCGNRRGDQGYLASRFEIANQSADQQKDNINPEYGGGIEVHSGANLP